MKTAVLLAGLLLCTAAARADRAVLDATLAADVRRLALQAVGSNKARVEIEVGRLDPRLRLAPCERIEPHLPSATQLWGRSRIGLRCTVGASKWNVFLPITVKVFGRALVARAPLAAGATLAAADLVEAEVDLAAAPGVALADAARLPGRTLARALAAGDTLRDVHLKPHRWFAAGEPVRIVAVGSGWQVAGDGVALSPGLDGHSVRVRTESGRIVSGRATAPRRIEVAP